MFAGFAHRVVAYVEIEAYAIANLVAKMEQGKMVPSPVWTDISTFNAKPFRDKIDLITGGYPCQGFSFAGQRKGKDDPRHLWPHIARIISAIRPRACLFENVEGHITLGFREVTRDLGRLGYDVTAGLYSAAECGFDHERCRIFILGTHANNQGKLFRSIDAKVAKLQEFFGEAQKTHYSSGREKNGIANRIDRIRLVGNGVVPQTAALAWQTLSENLNAFYSAQQKHR